MRNAMKWKLADCLSGAENVGVFILALNGLEEHLGPEIGQQTKTKIRRRYKTLERNRAA